MFVARELNARLECADRPRARGGDAPSGKDALAKPRTGFNEKARYIVALAQDGMRNYDYGPLTRYIESDEGKDYKHWLDGKNVQWRENNSKWPRTSGAGGGGDGGGDNSNWGRSSSAARSSGGQRDGDQWQYYNARGQR